MIIYNLVFFILVFHINQSFGKTYSNYTLYRGIPLSTYHLDFFRNLKDKYDVTFWRDPGALNKPVDFTISPTDQQALEIDASAQNLYLTTIIDDVQSAFDKQTVKTYIRRRTESFDWQNYFRVQDIYNWMNDLTKKYPKIMKLKSIGKTVEDRDIMAVSINLNGSLSAASKHTVIIEGGIHAREWISSAFATYFMHTILTAPDSDDRNLKKIAYLYQWHFVPLLNPDGYEYTHTTDRLWRKNRNGGNNGVDINRNFGYQFGTEGISFDKSSAIYCGPKAFSENESRAMANFIKENSAKLKYYFGFHSYGQYIIIPYASSTKHLENFDEMKQLATHAANQMQKRHGTKYTIGTAFDTVGYKTSGISGDWVKGTLHTPWVCTFELRDEGRYGFALPPEYILPTCVETTEALISMLTPIGNPSKHSLNVTPHKDGVTRTMLDNAVIVFNVMLFIIVRFDYLIVFHCNF